MNRRLLLATAAASLCVPSLSSAQTSPVAWRVPADTEIRKVLVERIDAQRQGIGIVVGVTTPQGRRLVAYGARAKGDPRPLDGKTVFEIGSMTKVFTSLLLSDMVQRGEVRLEEPVAELLPPGTRVPTRGGRQITLAHLATHTSGLPRLPSNLAPKDPANPYADYTVEQLYAFLASHELSRDIGAQYEYSNLGAGLLGHALARRAGVSYEALVRQRITGPLGMADTVVTLTPTLRERLAVGHDPQMQPTALWDLPTLAGAGALRSTADDMLTFLEAQIGSKPSPLSAAMNAQVAASTRRPAGPGMQTALGWQVRTTPAGEIVWHNGGTGGFRAFMGYNPATREGVVVLTNVAIRIGGDDIGAYLLTGAPITKLTPPKEAIALAPERLEGLVGKYQLAPGAILTVTRDGARLFAQLTGQGQAEIFAASDTEFFWRVADAQVTFQRGPDGRATQLTLHQNGAHVPAPRVE